MNETTVLRHIYKTFVYLVQTMHKLCHVYLQPQQTERVPDSDNCLNVDISCRCDDCGFDCLENLTRKFDRGGKKLCLFWTRERTMSASRPSVVVHRPSSSLSS